MVVEKITNWSDGKKGLILILCLSAAIKVVLALCIQDINRDGVMYIYAAQQFASGHFKEGLYIYQMPLYPLLIAGVHFFISHWIAAAQFVSIVSLVLVLVPLYLQSKDLFDRRAAFWACLLFAVAPMPNNWAIDVIRGPVFLFFFAWAVYFAQRAIASTKLIFFVTAALFAWLAVLLRIEGIILIPVFFLFSIWLFVREPVHRIAFSKGIIVWLAFPLLFLAVFLTMLGRDWLFLNRMDYLIKEMQNFWQLGFFDSYHQLYEKLKIMEASSLYPGGKQNFAEIARHYMPIIYLFGLIESFIKVLFPFFIFPLFLGFRNSVRRTHGLVLVIVASYLLMIFYVLIYIDALEYRVLFAPAFLLFPWIGAGCRNMVTFVKKSSRPVFLVALCGIIFLVSPFYKCADSIRQQDNLISISGKWLGKNPEFRKARVVTTDPRVPFFAGRGIDFLIYNDRDNDCSGLEQFAMQKQVDVVIVRISAKGKAQIDKFRYYKKVKEFAGKKNLIVIYGSPEFLKKLSAEEETATFP
jgi:4-amino-4-deoxy-L-arabinose transferase-like glycosyltransferase